MASNNLAVGAEALLKAGKCCLVDDAHAKQQRASAVVWEKGPELKYATEICTGEIEGGVGDVG